MSLSELSKTKFEFTSSKCVRPIPQRGGLVQDLLIQLSLDPSVSAIDFVTTVLTKDGVVDVDAIVIRRDGEDYAIDFEPSGPLRTAEQHDQARRAITLIGYRGLLVAGADVMREPRFSTARAVWSHRRIAVPLAMRLAIGRALEEAGSSLSLHELCSSVTGPIDPVGAVCALACGGELEIDLTDGLTPTTIVRSRS